MHKSTTLFLIGLCLISILGFNFFVVQTSALIGTILVISAISFIAGAITGYYITKAVTSTRYEAGVDKTDYIKDVGMVWKSQLDNIETFAYNQKELSNGIRYQWFRKMEYASQYYINESTFPVETVAQESGVLDEYLNLASSLLDSYDNLVGSMNSFCYSTLEAFDTLTVKATFSGFGTTELKGKSVLGFYHEVGVGGGKSLYFDVYYVDDVVTYNTKIGIFFGIIGDSDSVNVTLSIKNSLGNTIYNFTYLHTPNHFDLKWIEMPASLLEHGKRYTITLSHNSANNKMFAVYLPPCFVRYDDNVYGTYSGQLYEAYVIHVMENKSTSSSANIQGIISLEFYSDSAKVYTISFSGAFSKVKSAMETHITNYQDALSAGEAYWNLLRMLGYDDFSEIPRTYYIPPPSIVNIGSDVTEKLEPEELYALYIAYLKALEKFFTSETYRTSNMSSVDVNITDFSLLINCTAYDGDDNSTIFDRKFAILMPTTEDLTLEKGKNNTLGQTVDVVYFDDKESLNESINYVQLKANDFVYVYDFYKDGEWYNASSVTISIIDLKQLSFKYDFTLEGEPTYAYTSVNDWIPIIITVLMISMVIAVIDKSRRRR